MNIVLVHGIHIIKDKKLIKKVQRRFTKMINNMEGKTYEERLQYLKLWTLEERKNRQDLIEVFSERELTITFAICYRPSVCRLSSVCNVRAPYSGGSNFQQYFYGIWYPSYPLTSSKNFTEIAPGEPLRRGS